MVQDSAQLEKVAFILKTVAHPMRLGIVQLLGSKEKLSVGEICEFLGTEQSLTSHHLCNLRLKGILTSKREGQKVYYTLKEKQLAKIMHWLKNCKCNMG